MNVTISKFRTIILLIISIVVAYFYFFNNPSGEEFAKDIIFKSNKGNTDVYLGNPNNIKERVCFSSYGYHSLKKAFQDMPIIFLETTDSNQWFVGQLSENEKGIEILGIRNSTLEWNDYSSDEMDGEHLDEGARLGEAICVSTVRIIYFDGKPYFRPVYETEWRKR